ncbi:FMN-binding protein [Saccharopolyspora sp. K220]|uniref:FMN-binding protein n=1 Tax=Saccharopolyspora soli TaxID=2926618 RepID=UPI001F5AF82F|nr:FMN-binding protein [Saccharopolyspora soli]MCI2420365.1 FMN-binding protein [Saccharopolyspora soli]
MRRFGAILALAVAGLFPLVRYQPSSDAAMRASPAPQSDASAAPPSSAGDVGKSVDGSLVRTEYGPYQVRVMFVGAKITDVQLITEPADRHSKRIASRAAPTLRQEALRAQSANLDAVSGATTTSEAYATSLQAAIDARGG